MRHLVFALALLCAVPAMLAQTADTATVRGHVTDPSQAAVPGAQVTVRNSQSGASRAVSSDVHGNYQIAGLPVAGSYTLTASAQGFAPAASVPLTLIAGETATVDLHLSLPGSQTTMTVTGVVGEVRKDQPQLGDHLDAGHIDATPLLGNQITALPLLNSANRPAINMGDQFTNETLITTNGSGRRQTAFVVDGATGNDSWGRQTIFSTIPPDSIQEMTVYENAFSSEYGATTGGVVNIITKSGTSHLHGLAEYTVRPNGLAAGLSGLTSTSASSHPTNDVFNQGDWAVNGPVGEHTQFSIAGEATSRKRASPIISPLAPGNFIGRYRGGLLFARVDHQFNDNQSIFARVDADSFYDTNPNGSVGGNTLPSTDRIFKRRTYSGVLGETAVLSPTMVNIAHFQFQLADPIAEFDPVNFSTALVVPIAGQQTFTSGTSQSAKLLNRQYEGNDTLDINSGRHVIKFGADAIVARNGGNSKEFGGPSFLGTFTFATCNNSIAFCESPSYLGNIANVTNFSQSFGNAAYTVNDTLGSLFVQDDFHVTSNLTVNLGLRYERQTFTNSDKDFAPRVGFNYSPWKGTVVRGGYGIYYSQVIDNSEANYALTGPTGVFTFNATPGQVGFPTTIAPFSSFPAGATPPLRSLYLRPGFAGYYNQFFPTSVLNGYPAGLLNPYSEQWTFGLEHRFQSDALGPWVLSADYIGSHTMRITRPLDVDAPSTPFVPTAQNQWRGVTNNANGTFTCIATGQTGNLTASQLSACAANAANAARPLWIFDAAHNIKPAYSVIQTDANDGVAWYDALAVNVSHPFTHHLLTLISYTWSHALDTVDPDATGQNPADSLITGNLEKGNALFDQRHRLVISGVYSAPYGISLGGVATLASGLAYNLTTGTVNGGDTGAITNRPVINGVQVARNAGRGTPIYSLDPFVERPFALGDHLQLLLRAESFDVFNHPNFVNFNGTYGNGLAPATLGLPTFGITSQLPPREVQFSARLTF
ncbi:MAG TPA: TonB-dependent receptor [Terriglobales bacterium]|nr:TonB-dependent receptor [Terriglobales bacterium]